MSHHKEGEKKDKDAAPRPEEIVKRNAAADEPKDGDDQDVEGHNLFSMSDYYVQSKMGRQADIEKGARERALLKEAKKGKPERR